MSRRHRAAQPPPGDRARALSLVTGEFGFREEIGCAGVRPSDGAAMLTYRTPNPTRPRDYSATDVAVLERFLTGGGPAPVTGAAEWLTVADIARDLGKSCSTVYKWSARGYPHFPKKIVLPCGSIRVHRGDYEAWLEGLVR